MALLWCCGCDPSDVLYESHVQHSVCFIEDQDFQVLEIDDANDVDKSSFQKAITSLALRGNHLYVEAIPSLIVDWKKGFVLNTSNTLVTQLQTTSAGDPAVDSFLGVNTGALVIELDKTLVNSGGDILGVWASTRER